jgi:hypothetical protein
MYEKERAEIRILSNIADAQGLGRARDMLRMAEHEFAEKSRFFDELREEADQMRAEREQAALSPQEQSQ